MKLIGKLSKERQNKLYDILDPEFHAENASYEIINKLDDFLANQGFTLEFEKYPEWKYTYNDGEYIGVLYSIIIDM
jgi:hypothetical protein